MPLFETIENGSVKGLNEEVLRILCAFYLKQGQERENPHPYLADYKVSIVFSYLYIFNLIE